VRVAHVQHPATTDTNSGTALGRAHARADDPASRYMLDSIDRPITDDHIAVDVIVVLTLPPALTRAPGVR
jgi:hypothetical protein